MLSLSLHLSHCHRKEQLWLSFYLLRYALWGKQCIDFMRILTKCIHPFITQLKTQNNSITPKVSSCHFFNHVGVHFFSLLSKSVICVYHSTFIHNNHSPIRQECELCHLGLLWRELQWILLLKFLCDHMFSLFSNEYLECISRL